MIRLDEKERPDMAMLRQAWTFFFMYQKMRTD